jgi:cytochrome o ubiquinol oxidase operon protein cyoD
MNQGTLKSYIVGFISSIVLTLAAFFAVVDPGFFHLGHFGQLGSGALLATILTLAIVQLIVQLYFFLHLGAEAGSSWKLPMFVSTIVFVLLIVIGSLWIMGHLNYNMTPAQINQYMQDQQGGF